MGTKCAPFVADLWLCGLYYGALNVLKSSHVCILVFRSYLWHCDHLAWGRGRWSICFFMHLFVCVARVRLCPLSLPLAVGGWLRFVIVAGPGPFY